MQTIKPTASQAASRPRPPGSPPKTRHIATIAISLVLMVLWLTITLGAHRLAPVLVKLVGQVEIALGLDVLPGPKEKI